MSERDAFLAAIAENPADCLPRLIYADWLEERGEYEAACGVRAEADRLVSGRSVEKFGDLCGLTLAAVALNDAKDEITLTTVCGDRYRLHHSQDCCESVTVEDVAGNLADLIGSPLTLAEETASGENPPGVAAPEYQDSFTWTYYRLATANGYVTIRWYGESNGYYSESVDFQRLEGRT